MAGYLLLAALAVVPVEPEPEEVALPAGAQVVLTATNTDTARRVTLEAGPLRVTGPRLRVRADGRVYEVEAVPHQAFRVREAGEKDAVYHSWSFFTGKSGVHR